MGLACRTSTPFPTPVTAVTSRGGSVLDTGVLLCTAHVWWT